MQFFLTYQIQDDVFKAGNTKLKNWYSHCLSMVRIIFYFDLLNNILFVQEINEFTLLQKQMNFLFNCSMYCLSMVRIIVLFRVILENRHIRVQISFAYRIAASLFFNYESILGSIKLYGVLTYSSNDSQKCIVFFSTFVNSRTRSHYRNDNDKRKEKKLIIIVF